MSHVSGGTLRGVLRLSSPASTPVAAPAGEGRIYFDGTQFVMSQNGGSYVAVGGVSGWTDDGSVVRLTTVGDAVGIGTATPAASSKLEVLGDATRTSVVVTGGDPGGAGTGGSISLVGGAGGASGMGGSVVVASGAGGSTSGNSGAVTIDSGSVVSGTAGSVNLGAANASALMIGNTNSGTTTAVRAGSSADLTFQARGGSITLNQTGDTALAGFTATSIVGALNELKASGGTSTDFTNGNAGTITQGQAVYMTTTADTVDLATAAVDTGAAIFVGFVRAVGGIATGVSGSIAFAGKVTARFETGLTLTNGDEVYLSASTAGSITNVAPSGSGNVIQSVGVVTNVGSYDGAGNLLASIIILRGPKVVMP